MLNNIHNLVRSRKIYAVSCCWLIAVAFAFFSMASLNAKTPKKVKVKFPKLTEEIFDDMKRGGYLLWIRHAAKHDPKEVSAIDRLALAGQGSLLPKTYANGVCLTDAGRMHSVVLGVALKQLPIGKVYSSPLCRTLETAELSLGRKPDTVDIRLVYDTLLANQKEKDIRNKYVNELLARPINGGNTLVFAHGNTLKNLGREDLKKLKLKESGAAIFKDGKLVAVTDLRELSFQIPIPVLSSGSSSQQ